MDNIETRLYVFLNLETGKLELMTIREFIYSTSTLSYVGIL